MNASIDGAAAPAGIAAALSSSRSSRRRRTRVAYPLAPPGHRLLANTVVEYGSPTTHPEVSWRESVPIAAHRRSVPLRHSSRAGSDDVHVHGHGNRGDHG